MGNDHPDRPPTEAQPTDAEIDEKRLADAFEVSKRIEASLFVDDYFNDEQRAVKYLARAVRALQGEREWRGIEGKTPDPTVAPWNGEWVLIGWFALPGQSQREAAWWNAMRGQWCGSYTRFSLHPAQQPTHWQPLPSAPREKGE
jgi:hypothetical protein